MPSGHVQATVAGTLVAESDTYELVEGNVYFPPSSIKPEYFDKTDLHTHCGWKGDASYYTLKVGGTATYHIHYALERLIFGAALTGIISDKELANAAWYYPEPFEKAKHIKDYVAFYKTKVDIVTE
ncbi:hypothetical protein Hte_000672 [Hypoxylon texense]